MILCSGCFDGLHAGHVAYLEEAAALRMNDERLVVAVASDAYVRRAKRREPRWAQDLRVRTVAALRCVDQAYIHSTGGAADLIRLLCPQRFVKGDDWKRNGLAPDVIEACIDVGCKIVYVNSGIERHSSDAVSAHQ